MPIQYNPQSPAAHQRLREYSRDDDWIRAFLHKATIAHIAHTDGNQPFVTPTNFWYDEENRRIIFHGNIAGRLHHNLMEQPKVCLEVSEYGRLLPSNAALEFSLQFRSVMVFGHVSVISDPTEARIVLTNLVSKYFPNHRSGIEYRPITDKELRRTAVYALVIESWSGKENWQEAAEQIDDWTPLTG
jgi:uncharacterized protein